MGKGSLFRNFIQYASLNGLGYGGAASGVQLCDGYSFAKGEKLRRLRARTQQMRMNFEARNPAFEDLNKLGEKLQKI